MKLTIEMPFGKDLSVNHCRMGPVGNWHLKPHVEAWMARLEMEVLSYWLPYKYRQMAALLPVVVMVDCRWPDNRKRDDHNYHYVIANAVASGLGIDDRDIRISTRSVTVDRKNAGFTVEVSDVSHTE